VQQRVLAAQAPVIVPAHRFPLRTRGNDHDRSLPTSLRLPVDHRVLQQVQKPERLLPTVRNRYGPHQQLKGPSATVLPQLQIR
jgi:hypothetical protein